MSILTATNQFIARVIQIIGDRLVDPSADRYSPFIQQRTFGRATLHEVPSPIAVEDESDDGDMGKQHPTPCCVPHGTAA